MLVTWKVKKVETCYDFMTHWPFYLVSSFLTQDQGELENPLVKSHMFLSAPRVDI